MQVADVEAVTDNHICSLSPEDELILQVPTNEVGHQAFTNRSPQRTRHENKVEKLSRNPEVNFLICKQLSHKVTF